MCDFGHLQNINVDPPSHSHHVDSAARIMQSAAGDIAFFKKG
jgi:hypothetical protein